MFLLINNEFSNYPKRLKEDIKFGEIILKNFTNLTTEEKEMVRNWRNNENIRKWLYQDHIISKREHFDFVEKLKEDNKNFYWLVKNEKNYVGVISLNRVDLKNKNAYLGIYSNPEILGFGKLLMSCIKKLSFDIFQLHTLKAEVIETNQRAINFYEKSGFYEEGKLREFIFKDDKWYDVIVMGIVREDFENK